MTLSNHDIRIFPDIQLLTHSAAEKTVRLASQAIDSKGLCTIALAGGATPRGLYSLLATPAFRDQLIWGRLKIFWGDERHVPPDHPDSNFRMAHEALLSKVPIPASNIFRIPGELPDALLAADHYESLLHHEFQSSPSEPPCFDLIFLGMGSDGHTASLFPGTAAVHENTKLVAAPWVEKFQSFRITLTPRVLNYAAHVVFFVSGAEKADTLRSVLEGPHQPDMLPSQVIKPDPGDVSWFVDQAAGSQLTSP